ncbi:MAG: Triose-phosphate Transporter [Bathelium mastoideum]|nr:MAG: Triose-phosphate Transporter [Bathelium mastoideum]
MYKAAGRPDSLSSSDPAAHPAAANTLHRKSPSGPGLFGLLPTWLPRSSTQHHPVPHSPTKSDTSPLPTPNISQIAFHESIPLANLSSALASQPRGPSPAMESSEAPLLSGHRRRRSQSLIQAVGPANGRAHSLPPRTRRSPTGQLAEVDETKSRESDGEGASGSSGMSDADMEMDDIASDEGLEDDEETGLTRKDRKRRRRRKRRNTNMDERVAGGYSLTKEEEDMATQSIVRATVTNIVLIGLWYLLSISISVYNKWMFSPDNLDFHYPLFTTCIHMLVQFVLASVVLFFFPSFRPASRSQENQPTGATHNRTDSFSNEPTRPIMTGWFYLTRIGPCGAATGLDIGLGNMSLKFISLTFFTMCKSSVLAFVLVFAFLFKLEQPSWRLGLIICFMTIGVIMMVAGETAFDALGFILIMSSAFFSGFRWSLTQILLLRNPATSNPFSSIFFLAPIMFIALLVLALPVEQPAELYAGMTTLFDAKGALMGVLILMFPGALAFLMTASEFALLKRTSVVTLSICGIFKEVVTISAAGIVFHDKLTTVNVTGLGVTILSIAAYNWIKFRRMRERARSDAHVRGEANARSEATLSTHNTPTTRAPMTFPPFPGGSSGGATSAPVWDNRDRAGSLTMSGPMGGVTHAGEIMGRNSTSNLIRHSLSISVSAGQQPNWQTERLLQNERGVTQSPVKRPEDLD